MPELRQTCEVAAAKLLDQSILLPLVKLMRAPLKTALASWAPSINIIIIINWFFECEHLFIDKPMVITEPVAVGVRVLGLGSKLYPSNLQRMLNKDLTRSKQSLSRVRQNRASKKKASLAGCRENFQ